MSKRPPLHSSALRQPPGTAAGTAGPSGTAKRHKSQPEEAIRIRQHPVLQPEGAEISPKPIVASNRAHHQQPASTAAGPSGASGTARRHRSEPEEAPGGSQQVVVMRSKLGGAPANKLAARRSSVAAAEYNSLQTKMQTLQYTSWGLLGGGILFGGIATYLWLDPGKQSVAVTPNGILFTAEW